MLGVGLGIDCAQQLSRSQIKALAQAGCGFVCRYVTGTPGSTLTRLEAEVISSAGLGIVSVFETRGDHAGYFTASQGTADGIAAAANAFAAGQTGGHIFAAVDFDVQIGEIPAVRQYMEAFAVALGSHYPAGIYGSRILDSLGYPLWQAIAWSGGFVSPKARIVQSLVNVTYAGVRPVDVDVAMQPLHDLGWHLTHP